MSLDIVHRNPAIAEHAEEDSFTAALAPNQQAPYLFEGIRLHAYQGRSPVTYDEHLSEIRTDWNHAPAMGLFDAQLDISGEIVGDEEGFSAVTFPRQPSNILLIMRDHILEARCSLSRQFGHGIMLADRIDPVGALLFEMYNKPLGHQGHAYAAVIAVSRVLERGGRLGHEVSYAAGKTATRKLFLPTGA